MGHNQVGMEKTRIFSMEKTVFQPNECCGWLCLTKKRIMALRKKRVFGAGDSDTFRHPLYFIGLLLISGLLLFSCSKDTEQKPAEENAAVQIRIENRSKFTLSQVLLETGGGGTRTYTDIGPGQLSDYHGFDFTYRYAFIQAIIQGDTLTLQPIDYVGERRYTNGKFSFLIDIVGDPPQYMVFDFRED